MAKRKSKRRGRHGSAASPDSRAAATQETPPSDAGVPGRPAPRWRWIAGVGLLSLVAGMLGAWLVFTRWFPPPPAPLRKFELRVSGRAPSGQAAAIAPDGRTIAYVAEDRLWIRSLDAVEPRVIPDSEGAALPFWSPGSDTVGYMDTAQGTIDAVPIQGATHISWCRLPTRGVYGGATWSPDGRIIFSQGPLGLFAVSARGATPEVVLKPDSSRGDAGFYAPHALPGGRAFVFSVWKKNGGWSLNALSDGRRVSFMDAAPGEMITAPVYASTGHLLYNRVVRGRQSIWAVPFSREMLTATGSPFPVAPAGGWPSVSSDRTLIYSTVRRATQQQLVWMNREGTLLGPIGPPHERITTPALSPDNDRVAVSGFEGGSWDIWIHDVSRGTKTRLTFDAALDVHPAWSPDAEQIAFSAERGDSSSILIKSANGSGEVRTLFTGPLDEFCPAWSRDGYYMAYQTLDEESGARDLWYIPLKRRRPPVRFTSTAYDEALPRFSPDGRYLAYQSNESGGWEVYVARFPSGKDRRRVSFNGGIQPVWSYWSEELFYIHDGRFMAAPVQTEPGFAIRGTPTALSMNEYIVDDPLRTAYDVTDDGQRFVVIRDGVETSTSLITVVEHWARGIR